jgi:hypothetical protein
MQIPRPRKHLVNFYKISLFPQNNLSLTEKLKLKILKNCKQQNTELRFSPLERGDEDALNRILQIFLTCFCRIFNRPFKEQTHSVSGLQ